MSRDAVAGIIRPMASAAVTGIVRLPVCRRAAVARTALVRACEMATLAGRDRVLVVWSAVSDGIVLSPVASRAALDGMVRVFVACRAAMTGIVRVPLTRRAASLATTRVLVACKAADVLTALMFVEIRAA